MEKLWMMRVIVVAVVAVNVATTCVHGGSREYVYE